MRPKRKAVLFDLYGTLAEVAVDEDSDAFWERLARSLSLVSSMVSGGRLRKMYFSIIDDEARSGAEEGRILQGTFERLLRELRAPADDEAVRDFARLFRKESLVSLKEKPYARSILWAVANVGCARGLISNTEALLTDYDLEQLEFKPLFELICLSSQAGVKKPDPRIFRSALSQLGVRPSEAIFVGDDFEADVCGAADAGVDAVFLSEDNSAFINPCGARNVVVVQCKAEQQAIEQAFWQLGLSVKQNG